MGRFQTRSILAKLSILLTILGFQTFSVNATIEELMEENVQSPSILLILKMIESPGLKEEGFFSTEGTLRRHLATAENGVDPYIHFVPVVFKTRPIKVAPQGCLLQFSLTTDDELIQSSLAHLSSQERYVVIPEPSQKYELFMTTYKKLPSEFFLKSTNVPESIKFAALEALEENAQNLKEIKALEEKMTNWFLRDNFSFVLYAIGRESITLMHVYTSGRPLEREFEGVNNLREQIMNNDDPQYTQFKPLLEGLNPDKLHSQSYHDHRAKRVIFKPAIENTTHIIINFDQVTNLIKAQWHGLLKEVTDELERKEGLKGHSHYH